MKLLHQAKKLTNLHCLANRQPFSTGKHFLDDKYLSNCLFSLDFNITATNHLGSLTHICNMFQEKGISLSYVRTHHGNITSNGRQTYTLELSMEKIAQEQIQEIKSELIDIGAEMTPVNTFIIPWFPRKLDDLNQIGKVLLDVKDEVNADSKQFTDPVYRERRDFIAKIAKDFKMGDTIPEVPYQP